MLCTKTFNGRKFKQVQGLTSSMHFWTVCLIIQIKENRAALDYQQAAIEVKPVEHHHQMLDQFPFFGEEGPNSVLQLSTIHPQLHPYGLQLTQPHLQDSSI